MVITTRDFPNWEKTMSPAPTGFPPTKVTRVRPGHADLAGALKYGFNDVRNVLERASARETAARVAAGGGAPGGPPAIRGGILGFAAGGGGGGAGPPRGTQAAGGKGSTPPR